jgi:hypothetical protein
MEDEALIRLALPPTYGRNEEDVDGTMRESVMEIVWHVREVPFLVHLFREVPREKASA